MSGTEDEAWRVVVFLPAPPLPPDDDDTEDDPWRAADPKVRARAATHAVRQANAELAEVTDALTRAVSA